MCSLAVFLSHIIYFIYWFILFIDLFYLLIYLFIIADVMTIPCSYVHVVQCCGGCQRGEG